MYIVFEGGDGCGKSTQIQKLYQYLNRKGYDTILTKEPGGTELGEKIRALLSDPTLNHNLDSMTELLLYTASRSALYETVTVPSLREGKTVISDRNNLSSVVYQGYAGKVDINFIKELNKEILIKKSMPLKPDAGIIINPEITEEFIKELLGEECKKDDRFHQKAVEYHMDVCKAYLKEAEEHGFEVISYSKGNPNLMHRQILRYILPKLPPITI